MLCQRTTRCVAIISLPGKKAGLCENMMFSLNQHFGSSLLLTRQKGFHNDVGIMYMAVPNAVNPTPAHHQWSGLKGSLGVTIAFLFIDSSLS